MRNTGKIVFLHFWQDDHRRGQMSRCVATRTCRQKAFLFMYYNVYNCPFCLIDIILLPHTYKQNLVFKLYYYITLFLMFQYQGIFSRGFL